MKILKGCLLVLAILLLIAGLAYRHYLHIVTPAEPTLSASLQQASLAVDGLQRQFYYYQPASYRAGAPLVFVLHGSKGEGLGMRKMTGYQFDRLADEHGFIVVYPNGFDRHWNDCRASASYTANTENIDDPAFFQAMINHFSEQQQIDEDRVFATGFSNGGHMVYRLAYEMPEVFTGVAAIAANLPVKDNNDCTPKNLPISVAIFNGTEDPINPYEGGLVQLFGDASRGTVIASSQSAHYFASLDGMAGEPIVVDLPDADGNPDSQITLTHWANEEGQRVSLYTLKGSGHVIPSKVVKFSAMLGNDASDLEAAEEIWDFFQAL